MIKALCILSLMAGLTNAEINRWSTLGAGLESLQGTFDDGGQPVKFLLIRSDPLKIHVRIIDTFHELGKGNSLGGFSVREVAKKTGALITVNAGSTASYTTPIAVGLWLIHGRIIHEVNSKATNAGILCITADGVLIANVQTFASHKCVDAVQRGPLLARPSAAAGQEKGDRYRRTVVAVDKSGKLLILITSDKTTLAAVAAFLYTAHPEFGVQLGLNMDGDASSGLLTAGLGAVPLEIGSVDALVASAIGIYAKGTR